MGWKGYGTSCYLAPFSISCRLTDASPFCFLSNLYQLITYTDPERIFEFLSLSFECHPPIQLKILVPLSDSGSASPSRRRRRSLSCCPLCSRGRFHRRPPHPFRSSRGIHPPHAASSSAAGDTRTEQRCTRCTTCQDTSTDARPRNGQRGSSRRSTQTTHGFGSWR